MSDLAVYIHWPFCLSKCPYCDFNSHILPSGLNIADWRDAYLRELGHYAALLPGRSVRTIFLGGGTPSLMPPTLVGDILSAVSGHWRMTTDAEITLEANPTSAEAEKFAAFRRAGVNRLSLGVQALNDADLRFLGREHNAEQARRAIILAATHFPRFSFDLIYARVNQTPEMWQRELTEALSFGARHLSLYQLTIEPNTQFHTRARRETLTASDSDAARMYEETSAMMATAGLPAYEISNHAVPGEESRHNLAYWRYDDYIGIGPGAHGRAVLDQTRVRHATENHRAPDVWREHVMTNGHGTKTQTPIDNVTAMREALLMGLRLTKGVNRHAWLDKFSIRLENFLSASRVKRLMDEGLIFVNDENFMATSAGRQRLDAVISYLLAA